MHACGLLLFVGALWAVGAYNFGSGFFLTRNELLSRSSCDDLPAASELHIRHSHRYCWTHREAAYDRLVLVIMDAWRYDFARWDDGASSLTDALANASGTDKRTREDVPHYINKMPALNALLRARTGAGRLVRVTADPPTVTMQRLKGMTTGSLPTFADIGASFASTSVSEDNIISQLLPRSTSPHHNDADTAQRSRVGVFLGDDTWESLFPGAFDMSRPYPSFNVADLHGVDDGVLSHLWNVVDGSHEGLPNGSHETPHRKAVPPSAASETPARPWDVLVAHFLGVDHIGHRLGPAHESMAAKLGQMDGVIVRLVDEVEAADARRAVAAEVRLKQGATGASRAALGTLIVVLGDHGMTSDGNHGGASDDETGAAMFLYGSRGTYGRRGEDVGATTNAFSSGASDAGTETVSQVDIVPTISLLLGVPIPYASIGEIMAGIDYSAPIQGTQLHTSDDNGASWLPLGDTTTRWYEWIAAVRARASESHALVINAWQVRRYLSSYAGATDAFTTSNAAALSRAYVRSAIHHQVTVIKALGTIESLASSVRRMRVNSGGEHSLNNISARCSTVRGPVRHSQGVATTLRHEAPLLATDSLTREVAGEQHSAPWAAYATLFECLDELSHEVAQAQPMSVELPLPPPVTEAVDILGSSADADTRAFLRIAGALCRDMWTQFDVVSMGWGLLTIITAALICVVEVLQLGMIPSAHADSGVGAQHQLMQTTVNQTFDSQVRRRVCRGACCAASLAVVMSPTTSAAAALLLARRLFTALKFTAIAVHVQVVLDSVLLWPTRDSLEGLPLHGGASPPAAFTALGMWAPPVTVAAALGGALAWMSLWRFQRPAGSRLRYYEMRRSSGLSGPTRCSFLTMFGIVLIALRLWALLTSSFVIEESRAVAWLLQSGTVSLALMALTAVKHERAYVQTQLHVEKHKRQQVHDPMPIPDVSKKSTTQYIISLAIIALVCGRFSETRSGWLTSLHKWVASTASDATLTRGVNAALFPTTATSAIDASLGVTILPTLAIPVVIALLQARHRDAENCGVGSASTTQPRGVPCLALCAAFAASVMSCASIAMYWYVSVYPPTVWNYFAITSGVDAHILSRAVLRIAVIALIGSIAAFAYSSYSSARCSGNKVVTPSPASRVYTCGGHYAVTILQFCCIPAFALLLGPTSPLLVICLLVHSTVLAELLSIVLAHAVHSPKNSKEVSPSRPAGMSGAAPPYMSSIMVAASALIGSPYPLVAVVIGTLTAHYYFAPGHGNTFSTVPIGAAFIGWPSYDAFRGGVMILVRMYAAHFTVITLTVGPRVLCAIAPTTTSKCSHCNRGMMETSSRASLLLIGLPLLVATMTSICCAIARRHLMVWAVFAPKFIFDSVALLVSITCAVFCSTLMRA